jgi:predicted ATP-dependent endonuclease of OLD family
MKKASPKESITDAKRLVIKNMGPIKEADIEFGDLTVLVGPQASGKSIFLQMLKLILDKDHIRGTLENQGYHFEKNNDTDKFLNRYFGEGLSNMWTPNTEIFIGTKKINKDFFKNSQPSQDINITNLLKSIHSVPGNESQVMEQVKQMLDLLDSQKETLFYVPAQRVLALPNGFTKNFSEFDETAPYVLRLFSENLRSLLQKEMDRSEIIFPIQKRLKDSVREDFKKTIFHEGKIVYQEDSSNRKRLQMRIGEDQQIPFMAWSAGQKEFTPLLMSFYYLATGGQAPMRSNYQYVVIEEPEMGLHPRAIRSVILQIIELMSRGYKVIASSHSSDFLEFLWAYLRIKNSPRRNQALQEMFDIHGVDFKRIFKGIEEKSFKTYYFNQSANETVVKDISPLDAGNDDLDIADFGGLTSFASQTGEIVAEYANEE